MKQFEYYSTKVLITDSQLNVYSLECESAFRDDVKNAKYIFYSVPFYNIQFIELIRKLNKNCKLNIVIKAEIGAVKAQRQRAEILSYVRSDKNTSVRVVISNFMLHSKFYYIARKTNLHVYWIGSSNASTNSLQRCEELMVRKEYTSKNKELLDYEKRIIEHSVLVDGKYELTNTKSVKDFFDQGVLFCNVAERFTPNIKLEFGEHAQAVNNSLKTITANDDYISPFVSTRDSISLFKLIDIHGIKNSTATNKFFHSKNKLVSDVNISRIKKFGLNTSLGLWVPDGYESYAHKCITKSPKIVKRKAYFDNVKRFLLMKDSRSQLEKTLTNILSRIASFARITDGLVETTEVNLKRLNAQIDLTIDKLSETNGSYYKRLILNYSATPMPRIWDDSDAVTDFLDEFYFSLINEASKHKSQNLLFQSLKFFNSDYNGDNDVNYFKIHSKTRSTYEKIKHLICDSKRRMRYFCQFDLIDFYKYNKDTNKYYITTASLSKLNEGDSVYYLDDYDKEKQYFIKGFVCSKKSMSVKFEDGDRLEWENNKDSIYIIDPLDC